MLLGVLVFSFFGFKGATFEHNAKKPMKYGENASFACGKLQEVCLLQVLENPSSLPDRLKEEMHFIDPIFPASIELLLDTGDSGAKSDRATRLRGEGEHPVLPLLAGVPFCVGVCLRSRSGVPWFLPGVQL